MTIEIIEVDTRTLDYSSYEARVMPVISIHLPLLPTESIMNPQLTLDDLWKFIGRYRSRRLRLLVYHEAFLRC